MPVMDEFKEERAALKHGTLKEKLSYLWEYYRWSAAAVILAAAALISLAHHFITRRNPAFYVAMINATDMAPKESAEQGFTAYSGIDASRSEIIYDTSMIIDFHSMTGEAYTSMEKFMLLLTSAQLDAVVADPSVIQSYAQNKAFYNLSDFLTPEQTAAYEPYFYYVDYAAFDAIDAARQAHDDTFVPEFSDPRRPEDMEQPVPVGIYVTDCPALTGRFRFFSQNPELVLSVAVNTKRPEIASKYIDYLMAGH